MTENKRLLLALLLSAALLAVWSLLVPQPKKPPARDPLAALPSGSSAAPPAPASAGMPGTAPLAPGETPGAGAVPESQLPPVEAISEESFTLQNGLCRIVISSRGGRVISWQLSNYRDYGIDAKGPIELVSRSAEGLGVRPLDVVLDDPEAQRRIREALFVTESVGPTSVNLFFRSAEGWEVHRDVRLEPGAYVVLSQTTVTWNGRPVDFRLAWGPGIATHTSAELKNSYFLRSQGVLATGSEIVTVRSAKEAGKLGSPAARWIGIQDNYFAALFLPKAGVGGATFRFADAPSEVVTEGGEKRKGKTESLPTLEVPFRGDTGALRLFAGPKQKQILQELGPEFVKIIQLGDWVGWIGHILLAGLIWIHARITDNYGIGIILLTILIRILVFPLTHYSMKKMRALQEKMKKVRPKEKAIRDRFQKSGGGWERRQQMHQELGELYRKEGINPQEQLSGCLPMLIQIPIFFAFLRVLTSAIELRHQPFFLWITDLSQRDPFFVTPVLMGVTMFVSTRQSMVSTQGVDPIQKNMLYVMPLLFTFFCLWAPSGLVLYWLISNILQIGQQYLIQRSYQPTTTAS